MIIDGVEHHVEDGNGVIVPAGARHNVDNTSKQGGTLDSIRSTLRLNTKTG